MSLRLPLRERYERLPGVRFAKLDVIAASYEIATILRDRPMTFDELHAAMNQHGEISKTAVRGLMKRCRNLGAVRVRTKFRGGLAIRTFELVSLEGV